MNKTRRKALNKISKEIGDLLVLLKDLRSKEQESLDHMPASLKENAQYFAGEETIIGIVNAINSLGDAQEFLEYAVQ